MNLKSEFCLYFKTEGVYATGHLKLRNGIYCELEPHKFHRS